MACIVAAYQQYKEQNLVAMPFLRVSAHDYAVYSPKPCSTYYGPYIIIAPLWNPNSGNLIALIEALS